MYGNDYTTQKTTNALLFICDRLGGEGYLYAILKILYFAEAKHISLYGRSITGDRIVALKHGPVPSLAYDLLKPQNIDNNFFSRESPDENIITSNRQSDTDFLSESDIKCLIDSIEENRELGFFALKKKSHDEAYNKTIATTGLNSDMDIRVIAKSSGASDELIKYISLSIENDNIEIK